LESYNDILNYGRRTQFTSLNNENGDLIKFWCSDQKCFILRIVKVCVLCSATGFLSTLFNNSNIRSRIRNQDGCKTFTITISIVGVIRFNIQRNYGASSLIDRNVIEWHRDICLVSSSIVEFRIPIINPMFIFRETNYYIS